MYYWKFYLNSVFSCHIPTSLTLQKLHTCLSIALNLTVCSGSSRLLNSSNISLVVACPSVVAPNATKFLMSVIKSKLNPSGTFLTVEVGRSVWTSSMFLCMKLLRTFIRASRSTDDMVVLLVMLWLVSNAEPSNVVASSLNTCRIVYSNEIIILNKSNKK